MRVLLVLFTFLFITCDKCEKSEKNYNTQLSCVERGTFYDWNKIVNVNTEEVYFGIGTEYFLKCNAAKGQEELDITFSKFYSGQEIVVKNDTIPEYTDLLINKFSRQLFSFYKEDDAFFNFPQYLVKVDNKINFLSGDYVFYFEGKMNSGHHFKDSCIIRVN